MGLSISTFTLPGRAILLGVSLLVAVTALWTLLWFILAVPPWG